MAKNCDPCECGADDCMDCHPENFDNEGRYLPDMPEDHEEDCDGRDDCDGRNERWPIDEEASNTQEVCWESRY